MIHNPTAGTLSYPNCHLSEQVVRERDIIFVTLAISFPLSPPQIIRGTRLLHSLSLPWTLNLRLRHGQVRHHVWCQGQRLCLGKRQPRIRCAPRTVDWLVLRYICVRNEASYCRDAPSRLRTKSSASEVGNEAEAVGASQRVSRASRSKVSSSMAARLMSRSKDTDSKSE